jgi:hypothetical protein
LEQWFISNKVDIKSREQTNGAEEQLVERQNVLECEHALLHSHVGDVAVEYHRVALQREPSNLAFVTHVE